MTSMRKTFVLGVGAQKAGTSWLHGLLSSQTGSNFGLLKEYHVFDSLDLDHCPGQRVTRLQRLHMQARTFRRPRTEHQRRRILQGQLQKGLSHYGKYFRDLVQDESLFLTGDITPEYAGLSSTRLDELRFALERLGFRVVVVFLMRDPVERCWSATKMRSRAGKTPFSNHEEARCVLTQYVETDLAFHATRYDRTLSRISRTFGEKDTFIGLYETLFSDVEIARLGRVLGFPLRKADLSKRVNAGSEAIERPYDLDAEIARRFEPAYRAAFSLLGEDAVRSAWKSSAYLARTSG